MPVAGTRIDVSVAIDAADRLGEGPVWDDASGELVRVDITGRAVHRWNPETAATSTVVTDGDVGAVVLRHDNGVVLAVEHDMLLVDGDGAMRLLASVEQDRPDNRFNDCRCDQHGRLWAGTLSRSRETGAACLYRLSPLGDLEPVVAGTTISNGLGWSPDGTKMYFIDSTTQRVDVFDYDGVGGEPSERRPFATIAPEDGLPDGLTVDAEGGVWVCLFGGGAVRRYDDEGRLDAEVPLPTSNVTCPTFGGPDLSTLYITSARHRLTDEQLATQPLAGAVFALRPGVRGLPTTRFAG